MNNKVLLISMPWPNYNMPSIQISVLKAFLEKNEVFCEAAHWFLNISEYLGFDFYNEISLNNGQGGEAIYSYILFSEQRESLLAKNTFLQNILKSDPLFFEKFINFHATLLDEIDWQNYLLVGLTLNFSQNLSSLYIANEIKKRNINCKIILGGAEATSDLGVSLLENFLQIDYTCNGEGESVLLELYKQLRFSNSQEYYHDVPGLAYRHSSGSVVINKPNQLTTIENLPTPNFSEYFDYFDNHKTLSSHDLAVVIPIETSRGCYYKCSFCSLNIQWQGTRNQVPNRVSEMMKQLSTKYKTLDFFFVDNITPTNTKEIFSKVLESKREYRFFYEMRANIPLDNLVTLRAAGLKRVQIGVEAFSTSLLKKFNKKSKVIHNIQGIKNCQELGILVSSNLIINHPCTSGNDIEETLRNIELCFHLIPPTAFSDFGLIYGSPDFNNPRAEFKIVGNDKMYTEIYPSELLHRLNLPIKEYINLGEQVDWSIIKLKVEEWKKKFFKTKLPLLSMHDGGDFLKIEDKRYEKLDVYILEGFERELYLYARQMKSLNRILSNFQSVTKTEVIDALNEMIDAKIMFMEDETYLSLAISDINSISNIGYLKGHPEN